MSIQRALSNTMEKTEEISPTQMPPDQDNSAEEVSIQVYSGLLLVLSSPFYSSTLAMKQI